MKLSLETGDNPEYGTHALKRATIFLRKKGAKFHGSIRDTRNWFAKTMSYGDINFYLVARAAEPWARGAEEIVSTQASLIDVAIERNVPIVMGIVRKDRDPRLRVFDPRRCLRFGEENWRFKIKMLNFDWRWGKLINDPEEIANNIIELDAIWEKLEAYRQQTLPEVVR